MQTGLTLRALKTNAIIDVSLKENHRSKIVSPETYSLLTLALAERLAWLKG